MIGQCDMKVQTTGHIGGETRDVSSLEGDGQRASHESQMYIDLHEGRYGSRVQLKFRPY